MSRKKVLFVIVEGKTDENALGAIFVKIYDTQAVFVKVTNGDITTAKSTTKGNIVIKIANLVKDYAIVNSLKHSDFCRIVHIVDTDGVFIPNSAIIEDKSVKNIIYTPTKIITSNKSDIEQRNSSKRAILNILLKKKTIWNIPYEVYYMSCNLDHVLYGQQNSSDKDKKRDSLKFVRAYKDDTAGFLHFISKSEFSVDGSYLSSWKYIEEELHSIERHTNLGICFKDVNESNI